jgi:acetyl esterase/lipase
MRRVERRQFIVGASALPLAFALANEAIAAPAALSIPAPPKHMPSQWARADVIALWPGPAPGHEDFRRREPSPDSREIFLENVESPDLHVFRPRRSNGHGLLVMPGGSYKFVSVANEGVAMAERLCPQGYTVFVLTYRLPGEGWISRSDVPLQDAQRAMRVIRSRAPHYGIDPATVAILGFSAGGHLAASLAVDHAEHVYEVRDEADTLPARPYSAALLYPVVTMDNRWTHAVSRMQLLGDAPSTEQVERRSPNLHVDGNTPPVFIVHAIDDPAVPVENSLLMLETLRAAGRPVEAHLLQEGGHAFGTGYPGTPTALWIELYTAWLRRLLEV